jgi:hypothetical protein
LLQLGIGHCAWYLGTIELSCFTCLVLYYSNWNWVSEIDLFDLITPPSSVWSDNNDGISTMYLQMSARTHWVLYTRLWCNWNGYQENAPSIFIPTLRGRLAACTSHTTFSGVFPAICTYIEFLHILFRVIVLQQFELFIFVANRFVYYTERCLSEANNLPTSQEIFRFLWNPKFQHRFPKSQALVHRTCQMDLHLIVISSFRIIHLILPFSLHLDIYSVTYIQVFRLTSFVRTTWLTHLIFLLLW